MANYRKSFNFRNGVQVDNDNFIVNANGLVGIGTSVPTEFLDVYGDNSGAVKVRGLTTTTTLGVGETATFYGQVNVGSAITMDSVSGIISAVKFIGDASSLQGIFAISTTGWIAQGVGLHTFRSIGIGTTNPEYSLQVGQNPLTESGVAIESSGNIRISGVITATSFSGTATTATSLANAANITTGTINNARLSSVITSNINSSSGISTFNQVSVGSGVSISGNTVTATSFVGTATTATSLANAANITTGTIDDARLPDIISSNINSSSGISTFNQVSVGSGVSISGNTVTATSFVGTASSSSKLATARNFSISGDVQTTSPTSFDGSADANLAVILSNSFNANTSGIITSNSLQSNSGNITNLNAGIGTFENVRLNSATTSSVVITGGTNSSISIGQSVGAGNSSAEFIYTPGIGRLDINNYDLGGINVNLHQGTGTGTTDGFSVRYDNVKQFEVTYDGKVGVNRGASPLTRNFEVGGDMFITNDAKVAGILTVGSGSFQITLGDGSDIPVPTTQNFNTVTGISTFFRMNVTNEFNVGSSTTIGQNLYVGEEVGIGTTSNTDFVTGLSPLRAQVFGNLYSTQGLISGGRIGITTNSDGSFQEDTRPIPDSLGSVVPYMSYGNFQVDTGSASFITENVLIVPKVGVHVVGFGSTNLGLVPSNYNTNKYLTKVGINTYFARSIFDVGTASTTMNSYFIPPSLTQSELNVVSNLWRNTTGFGTEQARKVTPDGVVPGSIVYNKTTEEIQVGIKSDTFAPIIPIGGIIMWSGSIASIPNGWKLCDGTNGTPDLRNRFIVGAGGAYSVGMTGGRTDAVLPLHGHSISDPGHAHTYDGQTTETIVEGTSGVEIVDSNVGVTSTTSNVTTGITTTAQVGVALTGGENLPPFYALAYIMRTNA